MEHPKLKLAAIVVFTLLLCALFSLLLVIGLESYLKTISNVGVKTQPAEGLSVSVSAFDWGSLQPSETAYKTTTITNLLPDVPLNLSMTATPDATLIQSLTWNCTGYVLQPSETVTAEFMLTTTPSSEGGSFNFNIDIVGVQA